MKNRLNKKKKIGKSKGPANGPSQIWGKIQGGAFLRGTNWEKKGGKREKAPCNFEGRRGHDAQELCRQDCARKKGGSQAAPRKRYIGNFFQVKTRRDLPSRNGRRDMPATKNEKGSFQQARKKKEKEKEKERENFEA